MAYQVNDFPASIEDTVLLEWLRLELQSIAESFQAIEFIQLPELHTEPPRPRDGNIVLADGTDWNPGSGAGFYGYYGGSWVKLG